jgi:hypothetical protein
MNIYLYVKTHNKTGLKYLGKTIHDPHIYSGSGTDWVLHIKDYGNDVSTTILMVCHTKDELSFWGRYYSELFKVTTAMDDYGSRIWANRIYETGGGDGTNWKDPIKAIETAKKISHTMKTKKVGKFFRQTGKDNHMYGKTGDKHHNYGKKYSKESCEKISRNHHDVSGNNNPRARRVKITTADGTEYYSDGNLSELCGQLGMSINTAYIYLAKGRKLYLRGKFKGYRIEYAD